MALLAEELVLHRIDADAAHPAAGLLIGVEHEGNVQLVKSALIGELHLGAGDLLVGSTVNDEGAAVGVHGLLQGGGRSGGDDADQIVAAAVAYLGQSVVLAQKAQHRLSGAVHRPEGGGQAVEILLHGKALPGQPLPEQAGGIDLLQPRLGIFVHLPGHGPELGEEALHRLLDCLFHADTFFLITWAELDGVGNQHQHRAGSELEPQ